MDSTHIDSFELPSAEQGEISISHLYNLRQSTTYLRQRRQFTKTRPVTRLIGERRQPNPQGQPGFIRIDSVHQGDQGGMKGVYHINAVDEITQFEMVASVEKISERYLIPVLAQMMTPYDKLKSLPDAARYLKPQKDWNKLFWTDQNRGIYLYKCKENLP